MGKKGGRHRQVAGGRQRGGRACLQTSEHVEDGWVDVWVSAREETTSDLLHGRFALGIVNKSTALHFSTYDL